ncbi:MAG: anti-sigma factor antagonist [Clostridia bacterium]|nr:anti-sigma factor antagonist [Clostridia bacterium]
MKYNYADGKLTIFLQEEIDMNSCRILRGIIDGYIMKYQPYELVLDLSEVKFMDSSGIGLILGRYNLIKLLDSKMTIINASNSIRRLIELSNIKLECVQHE